VSALDLDALVNGPCVETFGVVATGGGKARYEPRQGAAFDVDGIFDRAWSNVSITTGRNSLPVSTTSPCFGVRAREFPPGVKPQQGGKLTLATGDTFTVADVQPDGFEYFYLILNRC
jgi:hypothetical protein